MKIENAIQSSNVENYSLIADIALLETETFALQFDTLKYLSSFIFPQTVFVVF